jgi:hypothetical protein
VRVPLLTWATLTLCLLGALGNAFFYLADPNYVTVPGMSPWPPVITLGIVYGLFGVLAWSQRWSTAGTLIVLSACLAAMVFLLYGRGGDWYGSVTVPNYYNQTIRLGSFLGGLLQVACLVVTAGFVLVRWLAALLFRAARARHPILFRPGFGNSTPGTVLFRAWFNER